VRNELLLGVLHCDLIGFHTYDYTRHFLSSCSRLLYVHWHLILSKANGIQGTCHDSQRH
jgi:trehalose-6-phosphate synthase